MSKLDQFFTAVVTVVACLAVFGVAWVRVQPDPRPTFELRNQVYNQLDASAHWNDAYTPSWMLDAEQPLRIELDTTTDAVHVLLIATNATSDQLVEATRRLTITLRKIWAKQRESDARLYPLAGTVQ